jgi:hypothetical protein
MVTRLSQKDKKWSNIPLNVTPLEVKMTVGNVGCTITSICMGASKFGCKITPDIAAKQFVFTNRYYSKGAGLIQWTKTDFNKYGFVFAGRFYGYNERAMKNFTQNKNTFVIVQVDSSHWMYLWSWGIAGPVFFDPWYGDVLWRWKKRYTKITGYALFTNLGVIQIKVSETIMAIG